MAHKNGRIQNFLQLFLIVLSLAAPCAAQTTPVWEFFGGYSRARPDVREYFKSSPILYTFRSQYVNLRGWEVSVTENMNRWFGGTLQISGHYNTPQLLGTANRERMHSILYGPRFFYRTPWVIPFVHVLAGLARADVAVTPVGPHASDNTFAVAAGGGLDINLAGKAAVRLFQAEYFRTSALGTRQNSYRASAGVVFYLGKRK